MSNLQMSPIEDAIVAAVRRHGPFVSPDGLAVSALREASARILGRSAHPAYVSSVVASLSKRGVLEREIRGKRTYRVALGPKAPSGQDEEASAEPGIGKVIGSPGNRAESRGAGRRRRVRGATKAAPDGEAVRQKILLALLDQDLSMNELQRLTGVRSLHRLVGHLVFLKRQGLVRLERNDRGNLIGAGLLGASKLTGQLVPDSPEPPASRATSATNLDLEALARQLLLVAARNLEASERNPEEITLLKERLDNAELARFEAEKRERLAIERAQLAELAAAEADRERRELEVQLEATLRRLQSGEVMKASRPSSTAPALPADHADRLKELAAQLQLPKR